MEESIELLDLGVVPLVPAGTRHRALTVPATDAAVPGKPSPSPPRYWSAPGRPKEKLPGHSLGFGTGAETLEPLPPKSLAKGLPGFGLRWSVVASSPPPLVVTDTIRDHGASAAAPEFLPLPRHLVDPLEIYFYIYKSGLLEP